MSKQNDKFKNQIYQVFDENLVKITNLKSNYLTFDRKISRNLKSETWNSRFMIKNSISNIQKVKFNTQNFSKKFNNQNSTSNFLESIFKIED